VVDINEMIHMDGEILKELEIGEITYIGMGLLVSQIDEKDKKCLFGIIDTMHKIKNQRFFSKENWYTLKFTP